MDFVKKAADSIKGNKGSNVDNNAAGGQPAQKQDYGDKAFAAGVKQSGMNINPETQEKITDGIRNAGEKQFGKKVPDSVSN